MAALCRSASMLPPILFDLDDIEHVALARRLEGRLPRRLDWMRRLHLRALRSAEIHAAHVARATFVCSDSDRDYARTQFRTPHIFTVPNSTSITPDEPAPAEPEAALLFVGTLAYEPNIEAAELLTAEIWPRIHAVVPSARLFIAGNSPHNVRSYGRAPTNVEFTGFVPDLGTLYRRCQVVVCPLRTGGGTRVKIIEAAARGKAIVSTRLGAEGLVFENGLEIVIEDDPGRFADACIRLLQEPHAARMLGTAAKKRALAVYDRRTVIANVDRMILELTSNRACAREDQKWIIGPPTNNHHVKAPHQ